MKRARILIFIVTGIFILLVTVFIWRLREPTYNGRTVGEWIMDLDDQKPGPAHDAAAAAVQKVGADCLPTIIWMLNARESWLVAKVREFVRGRRWQKFLSVPLEERQRHAILACYELGLVAKPAIPALIELLNSGYTRGYIGAALSKTGPDHVVPTIQALTNKNDQVRLEIVSSLGSMCAYEESNVSQVTNAVRAVVKSLDDPSKYVCSIAVNSLGTLAFSPEVRSYVDVPKLIAEVARKLDDEDSQVQWCACIALRRAGPAAKAVLPKLLALIDGSEVQSCAAIAIAAIEPANRPDIEKVMPILIENIGGAFQGNFRSESIAVVAECGEPAKEAIPVMLKVCKDAKLDAYERTMATNALVRLGYRF